MKFNEVKVGQKFHHKGIDYTKIKQELSSKQNAVCLTIPTDVWFAEIGPLQKVELYSEGKNERLQSNFRR